MYPDRWMLNREIDGQREDTAHHQCRSMSDAGFTGMTVAVPPFKTGALNPVDDAASHLRGAGPIEG